MMNMTTKKITTLGMLCGLAVIVNLLIHFPLIPSVEFLSYDAKDVIIVIGGFIYGAGSAFIMSVITSLLEIMYRGGNLLDVLMNVISTCTFACVAAWIRIWLFRCFLILSGLSCEDSQAPTIIRPSAVK